MGDPFEGRRLSCYAEQGPVSSANNQAELSTFPTSTLAQLGAGKSQGVRASRLDKSHSSPWVLVLHQLRACVIVAGGPTTLLLPDPPPLSRAYPWCLQRDVPEPAMPTFPQAKPGDVRCPLQAGPSQSPWHLCRGRGTRPMLGTGFQQCGKLRDTRDLPHLRCKLNTGNAPRAGLSAASPCPSIHKVFRSSFALSKSWTV